MKMLVCTDGSKHSLKALEKAAILAGVPELEEVAIIHVYDSAQDKPPLFITSDKQGELVNKIFEEVREERQKILDDAAEYFRRKNIEPRTILADGHPAHTIVTVAREQGFDTIVIGSRGYGGLEKILLGSVSNAVVQEAKNCTVIVVK